MGGFKVISVGYSFEPKGLSIAPKTLANFLDRNAQLYEQGADVRRIGRYVRNWWRDRGLALELFYLPRLLLGPRCRVAGFFFIPKSLLPMKPFFFGVGCDGFPADSSTCR